MTEELIKQIAADVQWTHTMIYFLIGWAIGNGLCKLFAR